MKLSKFTFGVILILGVIAFGLLLIFLHRSYTRFIKSVEENAGLKGETGQWVAITDPQLTLSVSCIEAVVPNTTIEVPLNHAFVAFHLSWRVGIWEDVWFQIIPPEGDGYLVLHVGGGGGDFSLNGLVDGDIIHDEYPPLLLIPGVYSLVVWNDPFSDPAILEHKAFEMRFVVPECGS